MADEEQPTPQTDDKSTLYVVAGANGSGKSTLTESGLFDNARVLDPDAIARTISPDNPEGVAAAAGSEALIERREALAAGKSLAVETTLAGNSALKLMDEARQSGYSVELHYVSLGDPQADAWSSIKCAFSVPAGHFTIRLELQETPGELDQAVSNTRVAKSGQPLFASLLTTLVR